MTALTPEKKIIRLQFFAVAAGLVLLTAKFAAYLLTHSNTIFTDALESIINVVAGVFALYSLYLAAQPRDANHPYGHGKVEFISAGFEGILIVLAGLMIIGKSVFSFFHPHELENLDVGVAIITVSGIINYFIGFFLERWGEKHDSLTMIADGKHLKSDAYSSFAIIAGILLIIFTNWNFLDNVVAIAIGTLIIYTGTKLVRKSVAGIMDEADLTILESVVKLLNANRKDKWIDVHNLRVIQYGNKLHIDCHTTLPWYFTLEEAHAEVDEIAKVINEKHSSQLEFFIHEDPCVQDSCKICLLKECKVRKENFERKMEWTLDNVLLDKKHGTQ